MVALSIACIVAAAVIVLMCPGKDTVTGTADSKAADSFDAFTIDNEPEYKEYSDITDPYERATRIKEDNKDAASDGYVISLKDSAGDDVAEAIDRAIKGGAQIKALEYTDRTYTCSSLDEFSAVVDGAYVETAEPDFKVRLYGYDAGSTTAKPNDPFYDDQYNIEIMNVPSVWDYNYEGQDTDLDVDADGNGNTEDDMIIAVIDSGLYADHEDFNKTMIEPGKGFVGNTTYTGDTNGHGTFVSGIIAAAKNNNKGMSGLLQGVRIMPLRVFSSSGEASFSTVANAINYAVSQKDAGRNIAVINMSLGGSQESTVLKRACNSAMSKGIIVVCAAGNDYDDEGHMPSYPAQYTMGVGSLDRELEVSDFSQRWDKSLDGEGADRKVWVTAPGEDLCGPSYSKRNEYLSGSGTSFACPEVAALAAVCKSIDNNMDQSTFMQLLKDTVDPSMDGETQVQDTAYGWGKVDFRSTVEKLRTDKIGQSGLTVRVTNKTDSDIRGAVVTVKRKSDGSEVQPTDGKWLLDKTVRYTITAAADGYESQIKEIVPDMDDDDLELTVTLEGTAEYPVSLSVKDSDGNAVPENLYTISIERQSDSKDMQVGSDGKYLLNVGWYKVNVYSNQYCLDGDPEFCIDDMMEDLSSGKTVDVTLKRDAIGLSWKDHRGTVCVKVNTLTEIIDSGKCDNYEVSGYDTDTYEVYGISLEKLFMLAMSPDPDEEIISVRIDGKRLKSVNIEDTESEDTTEYELEEASATLDSSEYESAYIAVTNDPTGHDDIMSDNNSMRIVIDGREPDDWLYAPTLITIETAVSVEACEVSNITDATYTGESITQDPVVKYNEETLTENEDYTVSYSNNVDVGRASVIITGAGGFIGQKTLNFNINEVPHQHTYTAFVAKKATEDAEGSMGYKCTGCGDTYYKPIKRIEYPKDLPSVKISKPAASKKKLTVKWKKVSGNNKKKIRGIEIQVSGPNYNKTFKVGKGKVSKKISGLTSKQKYRVRIRTYNYINRAKHVSAWSKWKTAKVR